MPSIFRRAWALVGAMAIACAPPPATLAKKLAQAPAAPEPQAEGDNTQLVTRFGAFDPLLEGWPNLLEDSADGAEGTAADGNQAFGGYIVQASEPIDTSHSRALEALGGLVRGFVPDNALWVELPKSELHEVRALSWVRSLIYAPHLLKVDPRLIEPKRGRMAKHSPMALRDAVIEVDLVEHVAKVAAAVEARGGIVVPSTSASQAAADKRTLIAVQIASAALPRLASMPEIVAISALFQRSLNNSRSYGMVQSGIIGTHRIWDVGLEGTGQIIAVADTGLHTGSCFFAAPGKVVAYHDWAGNADGDLVGHGTHVAGSVAGQSSGTRSGQRHNGMAPAARLLVQDIAAGDELVGLERDIAPMLAEAWEAGAYIHVDSWGDDDNAYGPDARTLDRFVADHRDFLVVVANGNAGAEGAGSVGSPATAKNVMSVGAIDTLRPERIAAFSARGPTYDGRIKPTLVAPGVNITSANHRGYCRTQMMTGTSMAAPTLAGAAALVREYFTEGFYPHGHPDPAYVRRPSSALLRAMLIAGAEPLRERGVAPPSLMAQGYGRVRLDRVLDMATGPRRLYIADERDSAPVYAGQERRFYFELEADSTLDVVLVWTDEPALPGAGKALVNDLDLVVRCKSGSYLGNGGSQPALANAQGDHLNVEEVVRIPASPSSNPCVAKVVGRTVPIGPQDFALVILGTMRDGVAIEEEAL